MAQPHLRCFTINLVEFTQVHVTVATHLWCHFIVTVTHLRCHFILTQTDGRFILLTHPRCVS